jgi:catechol 2,3-dioxygenase-like lactoylglutathione lyase family enzyme
MATSVHILAFSTSNYAAMIKFFRDFGFKVAEDPHDQLTPFFEHGRAARVSRGELEFQLEESESGSAKACFNLFLTDATPEEIERVKVLGYVCDYQASLYGEFHSFRSPDGGIIVL